VSYQIIPVGRFDVSRTGPEAIRKKVAFAAGPEEHQRIEEHPPEHVDMTRQPASAPRPAEPSTDRELLERFVATREQRAFTALVLRHGPGVLGVCRRVLRCEHDAEDVFQATFLTLARKAGLIPWQESIKHWLLAVAHRLALQARCGARRQHARECPASCAGADDLPEPSDPHGDPLVEVARRELRQILDEELRRLPEKYRAPVVLCYLEGKTNEQAAGELGWPTGSMSRRLARARALLCERLTRRGLAFIVSLCCVALVAFLVLYPRWNNPEPAPTVAQAMASLRPTAEGSEGVEQTLLRLQSGSPPTQEERGRLLHLALRTAQVAEAIRDHDPGRQQPEWRQLSRQMRRSALDLADALTRHDEPSTLAATRRLTATCQHCHATFRP
jgi:RNA polymerase sigma-70 factor (ECF subfamily)